MNLIIAQLDASMFIQVCGLHSLTKYVSASCRKTTDMTNTLKQSTAAISKRRMHISRDIENKLIIRNAWHHLKCLLNLTTLALGI